MYIYIYRKDLESASNNNNTQGNQNILKILELGPMIEGMYKRAIQYDELIEDIPAIASRLYTLQEVHSQASLVENTVSLLEQQLNELQSEVINNQGVLETIQRNMTANMNIFESNIDKVS